MNIPAMMFIDVWGRRSMLLWGSAGMGAFNFIVGVRLISYSADIKALMATHGHPVDEVGGNSNVRWTMDAGSYSKGVIASSFLFIAVYGVTWAPAAWVYISEIWPQGYRAKGVGLCAASNWAFNFALAYFVPPAFRKYSQPSL
jgi:MFS family permease